MKHVKAGINFSSPQSFYLRHINKELATYDVGTRMARAETSSYTDV